MKGKGLAAAVMIACLLTGCVRYDGSRIGNESQLSMEYRVFNGGDQQELSLKAGDIMQGSVERRKGSLRIRLCRQGEKEPVFEMENPASGSFSVEIEEDGRYYPVYRRKRSCGKLSVYQRGIIRKKEGFRPDDGRRSSFLRGMGDKQKMAQEQNRCCPMRVMTGRERIQRLEVLSGL